MVWFPDRRMIIPRMPLGAARGPVIRRKAPPVDLSGGQPVDFDGATRLRDTSFSGPSDSKVLGLNFWFDRDARPATEMILLEPEDAGGVRIAHIWFDQTTDILHVNADTAGDTAILRADVPITFEAGWAHVLLWVDLTDTAKRWARVNDEPVTVTWNTFTDDFIGYSAWEDVEFGATKNASWVFYEGGLADFGLWSTNFQDNIEANWRKFINADGTPTEPTTDWPSGAFIGMYGELGSWHENKEGDGFTVTEGALTAGTTPVELEEVISLVREPTFFDTGSSIDPWDQTVTFDGTENLVVVMISYESDFDVTSVVIDPGGAQETTLAEIGTESSGTTISNVHAFGAFNFTPISGNLTVRVDVPDLHQGAFGVWQFADASRLPTTGDHSNDGSSSAASVTGSITIDAGEEDGILIGGLNKNNTEAATAGGGQTIRFEDTTHGQGFTATFSDERGGLSGTKSPSFSWPSSTRAAGKWVLAA